MDNRNYHILIVDDEIEYQNVVSRILSAEGYTTSTCMNGLEALNFMKHNDVNMLITDIRMPVMDGEELIKSVIRQGCNIDILVITAFGSIENAVDAIKLGVDDYFVKSSNLEDLVLKVNRMVSYSRIKRKNEILINKQNASQFYLESKNDKFKEIIDICKRTADTNINILLLGESGVGKEVVANYIHSISNRAKEPFIPVNCQVFPENLVESELFGHEKGAFTGATNSRIGKFEEADQGTLFLDEIGDLPVTTQGKLLRALETKSIERVGSNKNISLDIRYIFATNKNLDKEINNGTFREDLFFRINTITLKIPPLRERREDIPELIRYFMKKNSIEQNKGELEIDKDVIGVLMSYNYPGNVRELRNIIERMVALSMNGRITLNDLNTPGGWQPYNLNCNNSQKDLRQARNNFEKKYIEDMLISCGNSIELCSQKLGITPRQLWNKIKQFNISRAK